MKSVVGSFNVDVQIKNGKMCHLKGFQHSWTPWKPGNVWTNDDLENPGGKVLYKTMKIIKEQPFSSIQ